MIRKWGKIGRQLLLVFCDVLVGPPLHKCDNHSPVLNVPLMAHNHCGIGLS